MPKNVAPIKQAPIDIMKFAQPTYDIQPNNKVSDNKGARASS